jgi:hypothetical protein
LNQSVPESGLEIKKLLPENLTSGSICDMYGWGGNRINQLRKISNSINNASECISNSSTKYVNHCTVMNPSLCQLFYGSPVICGGSEVSGILMPGDCGVEGFFSIISLDEHMQWINDVTGGVASLKGSLLKTLMFLFIYFFCLNK